MLGTAALKRPGRQAPGKGVVEWMFGWLLRGELAKLRLSRLELGGAGRVLLRQEMKKKGIADLNDLSFVAAARFSELTNSSASSLFT